MQIWIVIVPYPNYQTKSSSRLEDIPNSKISILIEYSPADLPSNKLLWLCLIRVSWSRKSRPSTQDWFDLVNIFAQFTIIEGQSTTGINFCFLTAANRFVNLYTTQPNENATRESLIYSKFFPRGSVVYLTSYVIALLIISPPIKRNRLRMSPGFAHWRLRSPSILLSISEYIK